MLNRRYLRVKVMQALYSFFRANDEPDSDAINKGERELLKSIDRIYDLYLMMLLMLVEVTDVAQDAIDLAKSKKLPTEEDLNPNTKFVENGVVKRLSDNSFFRREIETRKLSWNDSDDLTRQMFKLVKETPEYEEYMATRETTFDDDKKFLGRVYRKYMQDFDLLHGYLEEKSIYWYDDVVLVNITVGKTIQHMRETGNPNDPRMLLSLFKDKEDDLHFAKQLFRKTISNNSRYQDMIGEKTRNWEVDRIAVMDVLLMKMALCELEQFSSIPIKVSLNEYIEISKNYSTPKSKIFINGVLDKIVADMKAGNMIKKTGRGLVE